MRGTREPDWSAFLRREEREREKQRNLHEVCKQLAFLALVPTDDDVWLCVDNFDKKKDELWRKERREQSS